MGTDTEQMNLNPSDIDEIDVKDGKTSKRGYWIGGGILTALILALGGLGVGGGVIWITLPGLRGRLDGITPQLLRTPVEYVSENGALFAELRVKKHPDTYLDYDKETKQIVTKTGIFRNYETNVDGVRIGVPGPTFRLRSGHFNTTVVIHNEITGKLEETGPDGCNLEDEGAIFPNCEHKNDVTNIHYHGSHVTPNGNGDSIFVNLYRTDEYATLPESEKEKPLVHNGTLKSELHFGASQMPGTHWYHPHVHGSTGLGVDDGLAGALIIEGDFEGISEIAAAREVLIVIQKKGELYQLNGAVSPIIKMQPGEVVRFRFVSAIGGAEASFVLGFEKEDWLPMPPTATQPIFYQIAQDGVEFLNDQWENVKADPYAFLPHALISGNRADFLVKAPLVETAERYHLVNYAQELLTREFIRLQVNATIQVARMPPVLIIDVEGTAKDMAIPDKLRTFDSLPPSLQRVVTPVTDDQIVRRRVVTFNGENPPYWVINGRPYNSTRIDNCIVLGTAEEWTIRTVGGGAHHPFHIHINPFFVTHIYDGTVTEGQNPSADGDRGKLPDNDPRRRWQDTLALPNPHVESFVKIRMRYLDFVGTFVQHCHILFHEDHGMMQNIWIKEGLTQDECRALERNGEFVPQ